MSLIIKHRRDFKFAELCEIFRGRKLTESYNNLILYFDKCAHEFKSIYPRSTELYVSCACELVEHAHISEKIAWTVIKNKQYKTAHLALFFKKNKKTITQAEIQKIQKIIRKVQ